MASLAFGLVGSAFAGSMVTSGLLAATYFGVATTAIGWTIGSFIGSALFPQAGPNINIEGPRLNNTNSSIESVVGRPVPICYGITRISGSIIWASDIIEVKETETQSSGGKGGGGATQTTTTYTYYIDMAVGICEGPIAGVNKMWLNKNLVYNLDIDTLELQTDENVNVRFYLGEEDQQPPTLLEEYLGAGNVPGFRGQAIAVFEKLPLEKYGNRVPANIEFEVTAYGNETALCSINIQNTSLYNIADDSLPWYMNGHYYFLRHNSFPLDRSSFGRWDPFTDTFTGRQFIVTGGSWAGQGTCIWLNSERAVLYYNVPNDINIKIIDLNTHVVYLNETPNLAGGPGIFYRDDKKIFGICGRIYSAGIVVYIEPDTNTLITGYSTTTDKNTSDYSILSNLTDISTTMSPLAESYLWGTLSRYNELPVHGLNNGAFFYTADSTDTAHQRDTTHAFLIRAWDPVIIPAYDINGNLDEANVDFDFKEIDGVFYYKAQDMLTHIGKDPGLAYTGAGDYVVWLRPLYLNSDNILYVTGKIKTGILPQFSIQIIIELDWEDFSFIRAYEHPGIGSAGDPIREGWGMYYNYEFNLLQFGNYAEKMYITKENDLYDTLENPSADYCNILGTLYNLYYYRHYSPVTRKAVTYSSSFDWHNVHNYGHTSTSTTLQTIATDICNRLDISNIDFSDTSDIIVQGFSITERRAAFDYLDNLLQIYFCIGFQSGNTFYIKKKNTEIDKIIYEEELLPINEDYDLYNITSVPYLNKPKVLDLHYKSLETSNQTRHARSSLFTLADSNQNKIDVNIPITLLDVEAVEKANILLRNLWIESKTVEIQLPKKYAYLEPGDILKVITKADDIFLIIQDIVADPFATVICKGSLILPKDFNYNTTYTSYNDSEDKNYDSGVESFLHLLDIPNIPAFNPNNRIGVKVVATGDNNDWVSTSLFLSSNNIDFSLLNILTNSILYGNITTFEAKTFLPNIISKNSFNITLRNNTTSSSDLATITDAQFFASDYTNLALLIHPYNDTFEIIRYKTVTALGNDVYTLSDIVRGYYNTTIHTDTTMVGGIILFLNSTDYYANVSYDSSNLNDTLYLKNVNSGKALDSVLDTYLVNYTGEDIKEYPPFNIQAKSVGSDIRISWDIISREGNHFWNGTTLPTPAVGSFLFKIIIKDNSGTPVLIRTITDYEITNTTNMYYTYTAADMSTDGVTQSSQLNLEVLMKSLYFDYATSGTGTFNI